MAPIKSKNGDTQSSRQRAIDEDVISLELAQEELKLVFPGRIAECDAEWELLAT